MANSPVYELLERNIEIFENAEILIAGDIYDPMTLALVKNAKKATVIVDNYVCAGKMAAMIGQSLDNSFPQVIEYKHVKLIFSDVSSALDKIENVNRLLILLPKNKQQTVKLLNLLKSKLNDNAEVYTAGSNDGGGKSADSLLKVMGFVRKIDLARKCTLFKAIYEQDFNTYKAPAAIDVEIMGHKLSLNQDSAVFSLGKLDAGTRMLTEALEEVIPQGHALDLGCGCGVVGIALLKAGFKNVSFADVSASALALTRDNIEKNGVNEGAEIVASDMLNGHNKYSLIAVNPPFHQGISTTTAPTVNMIMSAKDHLTKDGVFYMVANSHLGYDEVLLENFSKVTIVKNSSTFIVYKASI